IERSLVGQSAASAVSFCISGPPGTGKSAWVRHLAGQMGLETIERRASDLLSPLVGMTEKAIASCFQEARDTRAFLVIDEADSLLGDRRSARTSWEITQVNEFLTWMESHAVPFAMTTNFAEHLDPASLRRFVFKLKFDFMTPEQARSAFRAFFAMEGPNELGWLNNLTPGDFANVRRRARIMGQDNDAYALMHMLTAEAETKPGSHRRIGFAA
ncbi:MAG: AAA family ATPase, partial [Alphaproteobacteria bacterium]|nr:AAA family ATPase [Alphaproteobacteria bacterium]